MKTYPVVPETMIHDPVTTAREYPMVSSNAKPLLMSLLSAIISENLERESASLKLLGFEVEYSESRAVILLTFRPDSSV